jgi:CRISPR system Cascade subunit CasE
MVRLLLAAPSLAALAQERRLPPKQGDLGYLVHDQLAALFQEGVVQPFRVTRERSRNVEVLGYSGRSADELREGAAAFATPQAHGACDWYGFAVKPMPEVIEPGRRLGFEVRACPVVRLSSDRTVTGKDGRSATYRRGSEVDAWVHRRFLATEPDNEVPREDVYRQWLGGRLQAGAEIEVARLTAFRRTRLVRKTHEGRRRAKVVERPDALIQGTLRVTDGAGFLDLLARGVGRHRAFGFGMLLLRPPE